MTYEFLKKVFKKLIKNDKDKNNFKKIYVDLSYYSLDDNITITKNDLIFLKNYKLMIGYN